MNHTRPTSQSNRSPASNYVRENSSFKTHAQSSQHLSSASPINITQVKKDENNPEEVSNVIMRIPDSNIIQRKCSDCKEDDDRKLQRKPLATFIQRKESTNHITATEAISSQIDATKGKGSDMDDRTHSFMQNRFGADFTDVNIHTGDEAIQMNRDLNAKAFTIGNDIYFNNGQYSPNSTEGKHLLAHELTHTLQQKGSFNHPLQRTPAPKPPDPLCSSYVFADKKTIIQSKVDALKATPDIEKRFELIHELKWILRCGSESEIKEIVTIVETGLGKTTATAVWKEAGTPFGGYRGAYPGYSGSAKGRLNRLGVKEVDAYDPFAYKPKVTSDATFFARGEAAAVSEAPELTATDLLYFYGHQYAQYGSPGVFANGTQTQWIDLRVLAGKGDFSRVKLIVSTSCATCCKEAVDVFSPLFPNAVILGYRKSAPIDGEAVRNSFDKGIQALKRPLLLDQPIDINAIIEVWKSVMMQYHPTENERLPGFCQSGTVHYLESGIWKSMGASDAANTCRVKGGHIDEASH